MKSQFIEELLDYLIPPVGKDLLGGSYTWAWNQNRDNLVSKVTAAIYELSKVEPWENAQAFLKVFESQYVSLCSEFIEAVLVDFFTHPAVKLSLGQNAPSPFPKGYSIAETDWSILEPMVHKSQIYREVR